MVYLLLVLFQLVGNSTVPPPDVPWMYNYFPHEKLAIENKYLKATLPKLYFCIDIEPSTGNTCFTNKIELRPGYDWYFEDGYTMIHINPLDFEPPFVEDTLGYIELNY